MQSGAQLFLVVRKARNSTRKGETGLKSPFILPSFSTSQIATSAVSNFLSNRKSIRFLKVTFEFSAIRRRFPRSANPRRKAPSGNGFWGMDDSAHGNFWLLLFFYCYWRFIKTGMRKFLEKKFFFLSFFPFIAPLISVPFHFKTELRS